MRQTDRAVPDRRVQRTQRQLQDALRSLLLTKPLDDIVVSEITAAADVNRATFYDHYSGKFDLFNALIAADFRQLLARREVGFDRSCSSGLKAIALAVADFLDRVHRDSQACSRQTSSGPLIDAAVVLAIREIILDGLASEAISAPAAPGVFASMVSGGIYGAVKECVSASGWKVDESAVLALVPILQPLFGSGDSKAARQAP